jgi:CTP:molybdopterin cytidylyltransferase MocA
MSISEIIKRLQEDRRIAERERRQARIEAAFAEARTVERRRYAHPGEIDPESLGRRKDDPRPNPPKLRPALSSLAKPILEDAVKAAPLIYQRRPDVAVHDLGDAPEVSETDLPKLLESCEKALGFKKPVAERSCLMGELEEPSIWKRDIFRMVKGSR